MIGVTFYIDCDGPGCTAFECVAVARAYPPGARIDSPQLPQGWNGVDTGRTLCPKCSGHEPADPEVERDSQPEPELEEALRASLSLRQRRRS